jgi:hypothetical protein
MKDADHNRVVQVESPVGWYSLRPYWLMNGAQWRERGRGGGPRPRQPPICTGPKGPIQVNAPTQLSLCISSYWSGATGTSPFLSPGPATEPLLLYLKTQKRKWSRLENREKHGRAFKRTQVLACCTGPAGPLVLYWFFPLCLSFCCESRERERDVQYARRKGRQSKRQQ